MHTLRTGGGELGAARPEIGPPPARSQIHPINVAPCRPRRNDRLVFGTGTARGRRFRGGWALTLAASVLVVWGCGQRDPSFRPSDTGAISVASSPDSAAIILDRAPTGLFTPDTLEAVSPGLHWVRVEKAGYVPMPCSLQVVVEAGQVASAVFELQSTLARPMLLESFTNTGCAPCAETNPMLYALVEELGPSRVMLMEFHTNFPSPLDPLYLAQRATMDARMALYGVGQAPWLVVEGNQGLQPVSREAVEAALNDASQSTIVDLTLRAEVVGTAFSCSVGASATAPGSYLLTVFLIDDFEEFATAPGSNGEKEFRHVVRGAVPVACGEEVDLASAPLWKVWNGTAAWRREGEGITVVAHARRPDSPQTVGLDVQHIE